MLFNTTTGGHGPVYFFYVRTPAASYIGTKGFPAGDSFTLLMASGTNCTTGGGNTCVAATLVDNTCGGSQQCFDYADVYSPGWQDDCCIFARMSTIGQTRNNFKNGHKFGPSVWSSVTQSVGTSTVPFVAAGVQNWPRDTSRILVQYTDADNETDTIFLHR